MPLDTNLNVYPYGDDFTESSDYHMVLFKPEISVQVRELNVLQTMLQQQIEKFGDNIFQIGTIIDGVNLNFNPNYNYVKIDNVTNFGSTVTPDAYVGMYVFNNSGLKATIIDYLNGYEATDPYLNTLYINYINSGSNLLQNSFNPGDQLRIVSKNSSLFSVLINNGGANFTNADSAVFLPALLVSQTTNTSFSVAETIVDGNTGARATILEVNTSIFSNTSGTTILKIAPLSSDLANTAANASLWTFYSSDSILGQSSGAAATVIKNIGQGAAGVITTDGSGRIQNITIPDGGEGYYIAPYCSVKPTQSIADLTDLNLTALNYVANVTVATTSNSVGSGYQASVTEGIIYQKGYFVRVAPQSIIVSPYSNSPNNISLVFQTQENIINSNQDQSLLDNVTGTTNMNAPGADRLQLVANLVVVNTDIVANSSAYLPIASFSEGQPFQLQTNTVYNSINDEMARRTFDEAGNFSLDQFQVTTRSTLNPTYEGNTVSYIIDPGKAYISGYRVQTYSNYSVDVPKGIGTNTISTTIGLNYDNYIRINEVGGLFQFNSGDLVTFYDTKKTFISNTAAATIGNTTPVGNTLGTARIRSMLLESGNPGTNTAIYRLYLFNIVMNTGTNFKSNRSVYYNNGTLNGIGDLVLETDPTTQVNTAVLHGNNSTLVFETQTGTTQSVNNVVYIYRTVNNQISLGNNGLATISLSGNPSEYFPYNNNLNFQELTDLYVVPEVGLRNSNTISGSNTCSVFSNTTVSATNASFISNLAPGDYIYIFNNTTSNVAIKNVISITNNNLLIVDSNIAFTSANVNIYRYFPPNVPIPFGSRTGLTANVDVTQKLLTFNLGFQLAGTTSSNTIVAYNVQRENVAPGTKIVSRNNYVLIHPANNAGGLDGPWCLGIPEMIRLNHVYIGNSSVNTSSPDIVNQFYGDNNENPDFADLSYLFANPKYNFTANSNTYMLVCFDALKISSQGFYTSQSYISSNSAQTFITDSLPVANLGSLVSTWEVPEFFDNSDYYYDLLTCFDFRPVVNATASYTNVYSSATLNPVEAVSFGNTSNIVNDFKFPLPINTLTANVTYYEGRNDSVVIGTDGLVQVLQGTYGTNTIPVQPKNTLLINNINIPAYPSLEQNPSSTVLGLINTRMNSGQSERVNTHYINALLTPQQFNIDQPSGYTMSEIAALEARISVLEYYTSLNDLENSVQSQVIPSSIDPSLDRFKYGYFVDNLTTQTFIDITNPEYTASLLNNQAVPHLENINIVHDITTSGSQPNFVEYALINQDNATYSNTNGIPSVCNTNSNAVVNTSVSYQFYPSQGEEFNVQAFNMAQQGGNVVLYFNHVQMTEVVWVQGDYSNVSMSGNLGPSVFNNVATLSPVALTNTDISFLSTDPVFAGILLSNGFTTNVFSSYYSTSTQNSGIYVTGIGKYVFSVPSSTTPNNVISILYHSFETSNTTYSNEQIRPLFDINPGLTLLGVENGVTSQEPFGTGGVFSGIQTATVYYGLFGVATQTLNYNPPLLQYNIVYPINSNSQIDCYTTSLTLSSNGYQIANLTYLTNNNTITSVYSNSVILTYNSSNGSVIVTGNSTANATYANAIPAYIVGSEAVSGFPFQYTGTLQSGAYPVYVDSF